MWRQGLAAVQVKSPPGLSLCQGPGLCEALRSGVSSPRASLGYAPACRAEDGGFSPVQCDPAGGSCWCVLSSGEEVPGTRVAGSQPACERKLWHPAGAPWAEVGWSRGRCSSLPSPRLGDPKDIAPVGAGGETGDVGAGGSREPEIRVCPFKALALEPRSR